MSKYVIIKHAILSIANIPPNAIVSFTFHRDKFFNNISILHMYTTYNTSANFSGI
jgi:hypothetical protein